MKSTFKRKALAIVVSASCIGVFAFVAYATHSWNGYHWARASSPFTLRIGDNVTSAWDGYLAATSIDWSMSTAFDTLVVQGAAARSPSPKKDCVPANGKVEVCNRIYGNTGWLGVAQVWVSGSHITKGSVKVNDSYFNTASYNTPAWKNLVMCQEVGHIFGLDHQDEIFGNPNLGTCMDYTSNPLGPPSNERPNQHDYDQLALIYSHLDTTTTIRQVFSSPGNRAGVNGADGEETADWGKSIRASSDGRSSLFERDLGGGNKVFTFVIWAR